MARHRRRRKRNNPNRGTHDSANRNGVPIPQDGPIESRHSEATHTGCSDSETDDWQKQLAIESHKVAQSAFKLSKAALVFDGIVAITAAIGACFIFSELSEMKESNRLTRETLITSRRAFEATQRAVVGPVAVRHFRMSVSDSKRQIPIEIKNTGQSAAKNSRPHAIAVIRAGQLENCAKLPVSDDPQSNTFILPGATVFASAELDPIDQLLAQRFLTGELFLYIFGRIRYEDEFSKHRETGFCFVFDRTDQNGAWRSCENNNWMDESEECKESGQLVD